CLARCSRTRWVVMSRLTDVCVLRCRAEPFEYHTLAGKKACLLSLRHATHPSTTPIRDVGELVILQRRSSAQGVFPSRIQRIDLRNNRIAIRVVCSALRLPYCESLFVARQLNCIGLRLLSVVLNGVTLRLQPHIPFRGIFRSDFFD